MAIEKLKHAMRAAYAGGQKELAKTIWTEIVYLNNRAHDASPAVKSGCFLTHKQIGAIVRRRAQNRS